MNDQETIQLIRQSNPRVITQLYKQHYSAFIGYMRQSFSDLRTDEVEDIYSESFQVFCGYVNAGKLTDMRCSIKTFIFSIGRNMAIDEMKRKGKIWLTERIHDIEEPDSDLLPELDKKTMLLNQIVGKLTDPCKTLLTLYWYHEKSDKEIVEQTNYQSTDTVKNQRSRCMKTLKKMYLSELEDAEMITSEERQQLMGEPS
ncbi:RNA polymerase sigma factor (sigma-70 family) [Breznakibacter xylanolyticus]|uniref:RNA polymerase sigma factor (Sigma-70 family) n=1 Tax=Breznakibacter xylanolyticus TaxID=990 RepID=A0A2W7P9V1_9BACT|nr:sigma-70 family RNA polymerase sigma factor [Breznakibacter xylanolyticus]PZX20132.1 RNA polymerase sigma factor (sigma-70 family) [Breznakibacter xylanolyticus]